MQEERIVSWAIDAQLAPATFAPVRADGLDAMQREAASVIAGQDRLVLIVGPAGAGKTDDAVHGRTESGCAGS